MLLAYSLEINAAFWGTVAVIGGVIGVGWFAANKKFKGAKATEVSTRELQLQQQITIVTQTAESWQSLFQAEKEAHKQTKERLVTMAASPTSRAPAPRATPWSVSRFA
jgi:hypothetical protein